MCYGEAYGECVYGGGDALKEEDSPPQSPPRRGSVVACGSLDEHLATDKEKQEESYPGDEGLELTKTSNHIVYTRPTYQGHETLEEAEGARYEALLAARHLWFAEAIGKRDREGIHRQSYAEQNTM